MLIWFENVLQRFWAMRARRLVASAAIAAGLLACGPRPAPSYPVAERAGLGQRVDWHRALGDPSWGWPIDPAHAELLESHRPLRTWSRPIRAIW